MKRILFFLMALMLVPSGLAAVERFNQTVNTDFSTSDCYGIKFKLLTSDVTGMTVRTGTGDLATSCKLANATGTTLSTEAITSNVCVFSGLNLSAGQSYYLVGVRSASTNSRYWNGALTYPILTTPNGDISVTNRSYQSSCSGGYTDDTAASLVTITDVNFTVSSGTNFTLTAKDFILNTSINKFNATINGTFYSTTSGSITSSIAQSSGQIVNITVRSELYNDTNYTVNISSNLLVNITRNYYESVTFTTPIIETDQQTITLRVNTTGNISNVSATLLYNGSVKTATKTTGAGYSQFSTTFFTSEVDTNQNLTVLWLFNITYFGQVYARNNTQTQEVLTFGIDNCTTHTVQAINFTLFNETNSQKITGSFSGHLSVYIADVGQSRAVNLTWGDRISFGVCIDPVSLRLISEGQFEYTAPSFPTETYYITNYNLSNITQHISLYLTDGSSQVTYTVSDEDDDPVVNAYIHVAKYDISTNSFQVSEIIKTDSSGQAIGNQQVLTAWYKFFIYYNNVLILETTPEILKTPTKNFRVNLGSDFYETYDQVVAFSCSLAYSNATRTFTMTFSDGSGISRTACINVVERKGTGDATLNNSCTTSSSGTLSVIHPATNKTVIGTGSVTISGVSYPCSEVVSYTTQRDFETYSGEGLLFTFLFVLLLALIGMFHPVVAIALTVVGVIGATFFGIFYLSWGALLAFILIAGIAMFRLGKE